MEPAGSNVLALLDRAGLGDRRALGRLVTFVERDSALGREALRLAYPRGGGARIIGFTGPPGAGKSTLVAAFAQAARARGDRVAIVAVDPSSPITGGAVLGDRIRMIELWNDPGVFVRSMAARQSLGGLAAATSDVVDLLDGCRFDWVLIETVGVGQAEVDVAREAHCTVVVLAPGMGDDVQAMKAGLMEIADVFVVNKADREGADAVAAQIAAMLALGPPNDAPPPVLRTVATKGEGIAPLLDAVASRSGGSASRRGGAAHSRERLLALTRARLLERLSQEPSLAARLTQLATLVAARTENPHDAADALVDALLTP